MSIQDLVSKSLDTIRQEMFDNLALKQEEYASKGWLPIRLNLNKGIVRGFIELWCWGLWQLYLFLELVLEQAFPDTATGFWLDLHCKQVGVTRKEATKATGTIYLVRVGAVGNLPIPAGRVVRTKPDGLGYRYRYVTTADVILPDGATEVAVTVVAEDYGVGANATVGQICEIVTVIPGIDSVENRADWLISEGADEEKDPPLRARYVLAWQALSGCTKYAYQSWSMGVSGVFSVRIFDQHPRGQGTVDVVIQGTAGVPTQQLLDSVNAVINGTGAGDELAPINDDVLVKGPTPVNVAISAELEIISGDPSTILSNAENRIRALFGGAAIAGVSPLGIGGDATIDLMTWAMMQPGVKKINWTSPLADVEVAADGLGVLQSIALTSIVVSE